jgi:2-keto-4-pentenoate hydratase/2-oxohepta-3-ene-1,7-dioic acid hydratase in catechol pathway
MRLITCLCRGQRVLGSWINNDAQVVDLRRAAQINKENDLGPFSTMLGLIESGERGWEKAKWLTEHSAPDAIFDTASCQLMAPLPQPVQIRDFLCFEGHLLGAVKALATLAARKTENPEERLRAIAERSDWVIPEIWYQQPVYYTANRLAIASPNEEIVCPHYCQLFDYELEFAAIIGKGGKDVSRDRARSHIFGYTVYNDWSARDEQTRVMPGMLGPGKAKDFDQGITLGPCIVTADEIPDPYCLKMTARVNGEQWSSGYSGDMYHKFEDCIADVTRSQTLYPGEVIGSGTVATGCGLEHLKFLEHGDSVELDVSSIGKMSNTVIKTHG